MRRICMEGRVFACDRERLLELPRVRDGNRRRTTEKAKLEIARWWKKRRAAAVRSVGLQSNACGRTAREVGERQQRQESIDNQAKTCGSNTRAGSLVSRWMSARFFPVVVWSALKRLFLLAFGTLRSPSAIPGDESSAKSGMRKFWLGFQPYLFWQQAFLICI